MTRTNLIWMSFFVLSISWTAATACSRQPPKEKECETPDPKGNAPKAEPKADQPNIHIKKGTRQPIGEVDWCRACVVGPAGFMSCQRVDASSKDDSRDALRQRARHKACLDSGFTKDKCPDTSVIAIACKDDKPAKDEMAAGKKVMKALKNSGPLVLTNDPKVTKRIQAGVDAKLESKSSKSEKSPPKADPK